MVLWFLVFGIVGVGVTAMLRSEMHGYSLVFASLVWGAIGVVLATALRVGEPRPRGRRVRR
jgi:hypothetical protein